MKITAITRYKHGELYAILQRIGWTQSDLARKSNLHASTIGKILNLVNRPSEYQANAIQKALGEAGEFLDVLLEWPETFKGLKRGFKHEQTEEVELENLIGNKELMMLPASKSEDTTELDATIGLIVGDLNSQEQSIIKDRFWKQKTFNDISKECHLSVERIRQIESKAIRKMRRNGSETLMELMA